VCFYKSVGDAASTLQSVYGRYHVDIFPDLLSSYTMSVALYFKKRMNNGLCFRTHLLSMNVMVLKIRSMLKTAFGRVTGNKQ